MGDSMVKKVRGFELTKSIRHKANIKVRSFPKAKVRCMTDHIKPTIREESPDHIIIHTGTNEIPSEKTSIQICNDIINFAQSIKDQNIDVSISAIVPRNDDFHDKVNDFNNYLYNICENIGFT